MPLNPEAREMLSAEPMLSSCPSLWMAKIPMVPFPEFREKRNLPSELMMISRFVAPLGFAATTVPGRGVSAPLAPIAKPEMVAEPAFETYTKRPSGGMAFQQFAAPSVGALP